MRPDLPHPACSPHWAPAVFSNRSRSTMAPCYNPAPFEISEDCLYLNVWTPHWPVKNPTAGDGLDSRRLECDWQRRGERVRRRGTGAEGGGGRHDQLPFGRVRLLRSPGTHARVAPSRLRQLRASRSDCGAPMGSSEHRTVWRRSEARYCFRRIGRLHQCRPAVVFALGGWFVPEGHSGKRTGTQPGSSSRPARKGRTFWRERGSLARAAGQPAEVARIASGKRSQSSSRGRCSCRRSRVRVGRMVPA